MVYDIQIPCVNVMEDVQREVIELCEMFDKRDFLVGQVEASRVGIFCL